MANERKLKLKLFFLPVIGVCLIFVAISSYFYAKSEIKLNVHKNLIIAPGSNAYKFWTEPPASILRKFYLYHIANPIEFEAGTAKPILIQKGPYVYREIWEKRNIEFLSNDFVHFTPVSTLQFVPELSAGSENDEITFLNIPAISMIEVGVKLKVPDIEGLLNVILKVFNSKLIIQKTVKDLISGYDDPLMTLAATFFPSSVRDKKFSLMNGENGTMWENYTMMTGYDDANNVGRIISWNSKEKLDFWGNTYANMINGTDGTFFPPFRTKDQTIYAFSPEMCRSYHLVYLKENEIKGVKVLDFHLPENIFANSTVNPNNIGFCGEDCLGNGVLNISSCYGGVSGFISQPHFLNADQNFVDSIDGMKPDKDKHDFVLHFEPTTGVPLSGNIRLQINFYVPFNEKIDLVKKIKPVLLPVVWFDDTVELSDDTVKQLSKVPLYVNLVNIVVYTILSVGFLLTVVSSSYIIYRAYKNRKYKNILINEIPNETTSLLSNN